MEERLKDCPFCGGEPEFSYERHDLNDWCAACKDCGTELGGLFDSEDEAIKEWNTRPSADAQSRERS